MSNRKIDKFLECSFCGTHEKDVEVLVVGDTIIDTYVSTTLLGNNAKTPTFSTKYLGE